MNNCTLPHSHSRSGRTSSPFTPRTPFVRLEGHFSETDVSKNDIFPKNLPTFEKSKHSEMSANVSPHVYTVTRHLKKSSNRPLNHFKRRSLKNPPRILTLPFNFCRTVLKVNSKQTRAYLIPLGISGVRTSNSKKEEIIFQANT